MRAGKVGENNGQLRFRPPPWVMHASHLDQNKFAIIIAPRARAHAGCTQVTRDQKKYFDTIVSLAL